MADLQYDGNIRAAFVPTVANLSAPTTAELTAGTYLSGRLTPDGINVSTDTASVTTNKLESTANTQIVGRRSYTVGLKYVRGDAAGDKAIESALTYGARGYLVIRRDKVATTAFATGDKVEVYPVQVGEANPDTPAENAMQAVSVPLFVTSDPKTITSPATVA